MSSISMCCTFRLKASSDELGRAWARDAYGRCDPKGKALRVATVGTAVVMKTAVLSPNQ